VNAAVIAALAACLAVAVAGPYLARALPPQAAVRLLVPTAVLSAGCAVFVTGTVAFTLIGQLTEIAEVGRWSAHTLHVLDPIPPVVAVAATTLLAVAAVWTLGTLWRTARGLVAVYRLGQRLDDHSSGSPVVVVDSSQPDAFTTPGLRSRIVVTTGMLAALDPPGRQVLLAHEHSHRTHRHTWWILAAELAAAVNPLLRPIASAVRDATERWADEDAALLGDRRLVAATIARVALLGSNSPAPSMTAAASGGRVPGRVAALLRPAPRIHPGHLVILIAVTTALLVGAFAVDRTGEALFEHAKRPATVTAPARPGPVH
jgi:Zn-dependent protease with chaperone function